MSDQKALFSDQPLNQEGSSRSASPFGYRASGIGSHTSPNNGATDSWITPKEIIDDLGPFDLDPCQCIPQPWPCASKAFTIDDDGLTQPWVGRVWLNPPYGSATGLWLAKLAEHGEGTALIFARTETEMFVREVWNRARAVLFIHGRLYFHHPDGTKAKGNSGGPSVLVAYGEYDAERLCGSNIAGSYVDGWRA